MIDYSNYVPTTALPREFIHEIILILTTLEILYPQK